MKILPRLIAIIPTFMLDLLYIHLAEKYNLPKQIEVMLGIVTYVIIVEIIQARMGKNEQFVI